MCFTNLLIQEHKFEIPYIWAQKKDYIHNILTRKHLWFIYNMDMQWDELTSRKNALEFEITSIANTGQSSTMVTKSLCS